MANAGVNLKCSQIAHLFRYLGWAQLGERGSWLRRSYDRLPAEGLFRAFSIRLAGYRWRRHSVSSACGLRTLGFVSLTVRAMSFLLDGLEKWRFSANSSQDVFGHDTLDRLQLGGDHVTRRCALTRVLVPLDQADSSQAPSASRRGRGCRLLREPSAPHQRSAQLGSRAPVATNTSTEPFRSPKFETNHLKGHRLGPSLLMP